MSKYHCWPFAIFVLGRTRRADDRGVNDGALRDLDAAALQMVIDRRQQRLAELLETRRVYGFITISALLSNHVSAGGVNQCFLR